MRNSIISANELSVGYGGRTVHKDISFEVSEGDYLCIVGENGAGKSTLVSTLLGLLSPISGKITYENGLTKNEIGYLPQQTDVQRDFPASVYEVVLSGCQNSCGLRPFYNSNEKKRAKDAMLKLNISDISKKCYRELSGGQQQRVLLARALCATNKVLFLDEPVAGLDPKASADFYKMISELNKNDGITVIMVSHDITSVLEYASHVLHIGVRNFYGTKEDYTESDIGRRFVEREESDHGND